jgi:GntR family transcriptional regulator / MocR family aminotransferase
MPRQTQGALLPPIPGPKVRRVDVYRTLRDAMLDGTLPPGARLPSTRVAASDYGLSRTTVEDVYEQLASEGLIERGVGRGSFVAEQWTSHPPGGRRKAPVRLRPSRRGVQLLADDRCQEPLLVRPFNAGVPDVELFPWRTWERCWRRAQTQTGRGLLNHSDSRGYQPLRSALASYLAQFRGVRVRPEQVMVFNSTSQALHAFFLLLLDPGDSLWVEDPGYPGAHAAARLAGASAIPIPVDEAGIRVSAGRLLGPAARMAYVTPAHQYPTGAMLAHERRRELLAWAEEQRAVIVEDDYDADFRYHGEPLTTLHALSGGNRVLYVGTLSKAMFLGLRMAYAVVPESLVEPLADVRRQLDSFPSISTQVALCAFINEGHLATHVRHMRRVYADKRARLLELLAPMLARGWTCGPSGAGMHFVLYEPRPGMAARLARSSGLALNTLSDYATAGVKRDGLSIRFGGLSMAELERGAATLCTAASVVQLERGR